jgi:cell division transport system permease protein
MLISFKRIWKAGFVSFWRNGFVSLSSVFIMAITLFSFGAVIFSSALLNASLDEIKSRVDVNVYFVSSSVENEVLSIKKRLEALPEVSIVEYISREQVLENFKKKHENDEVTLQALAELEENPFGAVLNIRAKETSQYESIAEFFKSQNMLAGDGSSVVDKVNYYQNKEAIDTLSRMIDGGRQLGAGITIALVLLSILISFNTIRLAIYIARDEIAVMKLVGASNRYIRGPFLVSGVMYGVIAGLITLGLFYPATYWFASISQSFFGGLNILNYYSANFLQISGLIIGSGIILGSLSSYLAVRKYLKM